MIRQFARLSEFVSDLAPQTFLRWLKSFRSQRQSTRGHLPISQSQLDQILSWFAVDTETAIVLTDPRSVVQWVNPAFTRLTGFEAIEVVGTRSGLALQGPETSPDVLQQMRKAILRGDGYNGQLVNYTKAGQPYWVDIETRPIRNSAGEVEHFISTQKDITAQRLQTEQLRQSKIAAEKLASDLAASRHQLRMAADAGGLSMWDWDLPGDRFWLSSSWIPVASEQWVETCGLRDMFTLAHEDDFPRVESTINHLLSADPPPINEQFRMLIAGKWRWVNFRGAVSGRDEQGKVTRVSGTLLDETDRRLSEERSRADRDLLQSVLEHIPHAVFWKDAERRYLGCNSKFAQSLGLKSIQEIIGRTDAELRSNQQEAAAIAQADADIVSTGRMIIAQPQTVAVSGPTKSELLWSKVPLRSAQGEIFGMLGIFDDITEQKRMERQLSDARHLESIGRLAAGVAHEINTPMQYISDNVEFLSDSTQQVFDLLDRMQHHIAELKAAGPAVSSHTTQQLDANNRKLEFIRDQVPKAIKDCLIGSQRVIEIVTAMKVLTHPGVNSFSSANVNDLIASTVSVTRNRWKYCATVELDLAPELPTIRCLPSEINQVLLNLLVNAADAVQERFGSVEEVKGIIGVCTRRVPSGITIEIRDNGCGIPEENQSRIFNPFFTTKGIGRGTGQGLTLCYGVVCNKHGGTLTVESQLGEGTVFHVFLPDIPCPVVTDTAESLVPVQNCLC